MGDRLAARFVSLLFQPAVTFTVLLGALVAAHPHALEPASVVWGFLAALPAATLIVGMRLGVWSDLEVTDPRERRTYVPACALYALAAAGWCWAVHAPAELRLVATAVALWLTASTAVSLGWKISLHEGATVGVLLLAAELFGRGWLLALAWAPFAVAWARLRLDRHTPAQLAAGALSALLSVALAVRLVPLS